MKFHRMELEAFGVFKDKQNVDFDALGDLYLIRGDNGAGKTTVLDAICFALYGDVPGSRADADTAKYADGRKPSLKSDYSDDSVTPYVLLEFSVAGTKYRVRRQPSWQPADKATAHNPKATLHIERNGTWEPLATSPGGVGSILVGKKASKGRDSEPGLLGLDKEQFSMTVMLPQGRFSQFIKASSDERSQILKAIFPVGFYDRITKHLLDNAKDLGVELQENKDKLSREFSRFCGLMGLDEIEIPEDISAWLAEQQLAAEAELAKAKDAFTTAEENLAKANGLLASVKASNENAAARETAEAGLKIANTKLSEFENHLKTLGLTVSAFIEPLIGQKLAKSLQDVEGQLSALEARATIQQDIDELTAELNENGPEVKAQEEVIRVTKGEIEAATQAQIDLAELRTSLTALETEIDKVRQVEELVDALHDLENDELPLKSRREDAQADVDKAKVALAKLLTNREESAAARLAEKLVKGKACAVCGSKDHPKHAIYNGVIPTEKMISTAEGKIKKAEDSLNLVNTAWTTHEATKNEKNRTLAAVHKLKTLEQAQALVKGLEGQVKKQSKLELEVESLTNKAGGIKQLEGRLAKEEILLGTLKTEHDRVIIELQNKKAELAAVKFVARMSKDMDELEDQQSDLQAKIDFINKFTNDWLDAQLKKSAAVGELEGLLPASKSSAISLETAEAEAARALGSQNDANTTVKNLERALGEIQKVQHFPDLEKSIASILSKLEIAETVADTANGRRGKYVPLTNFYLGERLRQITALASERWMQISDNRFQLEHVESVTNRTAKSGLELLYVDNWTGAKRPVDSLSGGELFMASISLALALSDIVKGESGTSVSLDTLFVDEGFGSLDPEHAEKVVTVLESLRVYGRTVCLVSHVQGIQERIPTQLQIQKSKSGSNILSKKY